ncbi:hypothetical protein SAMD00020551_2664 [Mesobacillus selenatarsenatis SF-1]|uniref:Uncharacterized protein n=1 Tax=Mesobacillus selenatarsenatis (strain DSM 18680 / JCM 14380 / FERM P-15431 / SF-1) TaxID=1321606 RepID=A0A0A8X3L5_MESS1|nr:hypothetical protein SAMD00020551_2664 [Mesobacillus selenatarsenatis SF-1]
MKKLEVELFHNSSPRKAKRLERKSTADFQSLGNKKGWNLKVPSLLSIKLP